MRKPKVILTGIGRVYRRESLLAVEVRWDRWREVLCNLHCNARGEDALSGPPERPQAGLGKCFSILHIHMIETKADGGTTPASYAQVVLGQRGLRQ